MKADNILELIDEKVINIDDRSTILNATLNAGIPHYHACGGNARCSTCRVFVVEGEENLSIPNEAELALREAKKFPENIRLACQTKVTGSTVKIKRVIKDDVDAQMYVYKNDCKVFQNVGKEKTLVLFFLDIRNFTPFIEQNLPFDVIHILRRLSIPFREIVNANNGKIIESSGDGFYAVFGMDDNIKTAVNNAVNSGYAMLNELKNFNKNYLVLYFNQEINVGIGIHKGNVIVGTNGFAGQESLTVMGFPVNVAARLEQATKELNNNFIISEDVFDYFNTKAEFDSRQIGVKGVENNITVRLLGDRYKD